MDLSAPGFGPELETSRLAPRAKLRGLYACLEEIQCVSVGPLSGVLRFVPQSVEFWGKNTTNVCRIERWTVTIRCGYDLCLIGKWTHDYPGLDETVLNDCTIASEDQLLLFTSSHTQDREVVDRCSSLNVLQCDASAMLLYAVPVLV